MVSRPGVVTIQKISNLIMLVHITIFALKKIKKSHKPLKNSLIGKLCMFHFMFTPL